MDRASATGHRGNGQGTKEVKFILSQGKLAP